MMTNQQSQHWVDKLVDGILKWQAKNGILTLHVDDMKTPSGRVHVGALRGVILHDLVAKVLSEKTGQAVASTYVFNDMDNMDSLPGYLPVEYAGHMGRSLDKIPAPPLDQSGINFLGVSDEKKSPYQHATNMGEFYALDFIEAFRILGCSQEIVWSHQLYQSGKMDEVIRQALDAVAKLRKVYQKVADYQLPEQWYPFQVTCEQCGLTGSTLVTGWDGEQVSYICQENKVEWAHGCGHAGKISPFGGNGKLLWKVDWPGHWKALGITIEGAGKDHTSAGGSRDMANAICNQVFQIPAPFDIPYEWILIKGTKMSSSKGIGTSARDFISLFPPEVGRFLFVNKQYNQVIDFDPTTMAIPDLLDEYDQAAKIYWGQEQGDTRLGRSFELSQLGATPQPHFLPRFRDLALWMQYPELDLATEFKKIKGSALTDQERTELATRVEYAKIWVRGYAPAEYQFIATNQLPEEAKTLTADQVNFLEQINQHLAQNATTLPENLQQWIFEAAKTSLGSKPAFQAIYLAYLGKEAGPKAAWFLLSLDPQLRTERINQLKALQKG